MNLRIERFDIAEATPADIAAHVELVVASTTVDRPGDPLPNRDGVVASLTTGLSGRGLPQVWTAHAGDELVGKGIVGQPADENDHMSIIDMQVAPTHRRRGVGSALLREMMPTIAAPGRTLATSWSVVEDTPGAFWAEKLGGRVTTRVVVQAVDLATVDRTLWEIPAPAGYRPVAWKNAAPDDLVESFAKARTAIEEADLDDWSYQVPAWTAERVRQAEAELRARNAEQRIVAVLHESSGDVVGLTELVLYSPEATLGFQYDTAVLPEHRGHGLGAFMKAQQLLGIAAERPTVQRVGTSTNASNESSLRMNRRVGYHPVRVGMAVEMPSAELAERVQSTRQ